MRIALVLFNGVTFLDFVGFYDVIYRLNLFDKTKGTTWDICGLVEEVTDELGMKVKVNVIKPDLSAYDLVFIPGGMGTRKLKDDAVFIDWIKTAELAKYKISVCTGSLLWGAAGFLKDKKATTHPNVYDLLEPYCLEVMKSRIVKDGNIITAGGVATSIDLGLFIIELFAGAEAANVVKKQLDYPYTAVGIVEV
ncbi:DJ-1/PfpI family protein [Paenibacillus timonensis]|uniref:DJ-1/PfpI family protein n=1 Tax=Paenibacillus timonensis TaxID=225915 RepID=A0ABW3SIL5_9BACL|nr:DJ-1/PfpI family protein [Paenibacillus timonensis]EBK2060080.1 DJ-1/PfpI family protein [Salmonella enterica subsp. enterica serovar Typhi]MCH1643121.1 DJ-1/PfpI family protein [Paenibacillus timonensis]GJM78717.1 transcriptional regulator [Paenibacillus sp. HMSSN-139]